MKNDASHLRKERIRLINEMLNKQFGKGIEKVSIKKFLALVQFNTGLTKRTARSYLMILADLDLFQVGVESIRRG